MRALLVHNPTAGTKGHDRDSLVDALQLADFKVDYVSTKDDDITTALKGSRDLVVAAGGDGTVRFVFTHLTDRTIPIGVMPLGSANNIARSLGIAGTAAELAEQWRIGQVRPFRLMAATEEGRARALCSEGFGAGLIAALIKQRAKGKKADGADDIRRGRQALKEILKEAEPLDVAIDIDGSPWNDEIVSVDVLNIPFTGPALPLAHGADPGDRLLDVIGVATGKRDDLLEWIKAPHEEAPPVLRRRGRKVEISWRGVESRIDDQLFEAEPEWRRITLSCDSEPLRILVPAKHPAIKKSAKDRDDEPASSHLG